jgi:hydroxyethylthiazole kinase-like sugar kinase family protein
LNTLFTFKGYFDFIADGEYVVFIGGFAIYMPSVIGNGFWGVDIDDVLAYVT